MEYYGFCSVSILGVIDSVGREVDDRDGHRLPFVVRYVVPGGIDRSTQKKRPLSGFLHCCLFGDSIEKHAHRIVKGAWISGMGGMRGVAVRDERGEYVRDERGNKVLMNVFVPAGFETFSDEG